MLTRTLRVFGGHTLFLQIILHVCKNIIGSKTEKVKDVQTIGSRGLSMRFFFFFCSIFGYISQTKRLKPHFYLSVRLGPLDLQLLSRLSLAVLNLVPHFSRSSSMSASILVPFPPHTNMWGRSPIDDPVTSRTALNPIRW